jgi:hypothetical protein
MCKSIPTEYFLCERTHCIAANSCRASLRNESDCPSIATTAKEGRELMEERCECRLLEELKGAQLSSHQLRKELITLSFPPLGGGGGTGDSSLSTFIELHLDLCNSGWAECYKDGKLVKSGSAMIKKESPNLVTVNEICSNDATQYLHPTPAVSWPKDWKYLVFTLAFVKSNDSAYHCTNGG